MPTENKRLKELQNILGFKNQKDFAAIFGLQQGSLSDIYREKAGVGVSNSIKRILEKDYSINIDWLETGIGNIKKDQANTKAIEETDTDYKNKETQIEILLRAVDRLSDSEKINGLNIQELIAQGRQQNENITKLVNILSEKFDVSIPDIKGEKGASEGKNGDKSTKSYKTKAG